MLLLLFMDKKHLYVHTKESAYTIISRPVAFDCFHIQGAPNLSNLDLKFDVVTHSLSTANTLILSC